IRDGHVTGVQTCALPISPQVGLPREERLRNVRDAFKPRAGAAPGRRAVLIDDVQTTGETLEEAAKALLTAGAHAVYALTLCWEEIGRASCRERVEIWVVA